ncbi:MAG: CusA/CzcA family heavy metal efflux RND transporter [Spirochaetes bacterium]|nr:CusA/CzcA family heavy metal efflux RND transporter [Spirochaetota bacterium]
MINRIIEFSLKNKFLIIMVFLLLMFLSIIYLPRLPVDAIPDIGENQVIVYADWPGRSPKDVEDQLTYPLTTALLGIPGVKTVRGNSMFGFSLVNIIFKDGVEFYWARTRVLEKLNLAEKELPEGVIPVLGPDASPLGQVFWYTVEGDGYSLGELRSIQDWFIRYQLTAVDGVSEVATVGGHVKQYQIDIDPNKLLSYKIPLSKVIMAVKMANRDVGAQVLEENGMEYIIRSVGFIKSIKDIENIVIGTSGEGGTPVFIRNVARVNLGPDFRRNVLDNSGREVVGGVVLQRYMENPRMVITKLKEKIKAISPGLPKGVKIIPFYDRTKLVDRSVMNLVITIILQIIITVLVILFFLAEYRSSFAVSIVMPAAVLITMPLLYIFKVSPNIMSLGGIAIAIGVVVDAGIVVVENIFSHLNRYKEGSEKGTQRKIPIEVYIDAVKEVAGPIFFTMVIIIVAFTNVYFLEGQAGKLFKPLAYAKNFVMATAAVVSITLIPVVAMLLVRPARKGSRSLKMSEKVNSSLNKIYMPSLKWVLNNKVKFLIISFSVLVLSFLLLFTVESEFMPPLDEGDILFMPVLLPGASISEVKHVLSVQDKIIKTFPEVESVVGKAGRAETATDPAPLSMIETIIQLKKEKYWRKGMTKSKLLKEMDEALRIPGVANIWTQPIRNRIDMLATGIQTPIGVKIFGNDLEELERIAIEVEGVVKTVEGNKSPYAERIGNKPYIEIRIDREAAARYGVNIEDVNNVIMTAIGGMNLTRTVEGRQRNPVRVRYLREYRGSLESIKRVLVPSSSGSQVPLVQLAEIKKVPGPAKISTENGLPYVRVFINVDTDTRGILDFVDDAKFKVSEKVNLPSGYFIVWSGQYEYELKTRKRLLLITPITIVVIFLLLYLRFRSYGAAFAILSALPFGFIGGIILQFILGVKSSTAVTIGYIALFGVAVEDGVVLTEFLIRKAKEKRDLIKSVLEAGSLRVRAIVMTTATTVIALLPVLLSSGSGSEIMRPIAIPTFGGMITATLSNLYLLPVLFVLFKNKKTGLVPE